MSLLPTSASWWNPEILYRGLTSANPSSTAQIIIAAVAGQHIMVTSFKTDVDNTTGTLSTGAELWHGVVGSWAAAAITERMGLVDGNCMSPSTHGLGSFSPLVWGVRGALQVPVNTRVNVRTWQNCGVAARYQVSYYMVDSTTLRPV